jgi:hypothetical protein
MKTQIINYGELALFIASRFEKIPFFGYFENRQT